MAQNNTFTFIGNLGNDPLTVTPENGTEYVEITVCTNDSYQNTQTGEWIKQPGIWHKVRFFGNQAKNYANYFQKSQRIQVTGKIDYYKIEGTNGKDYKIASFIGKRIEAAPLASKAEQ